MIEELEKKFSERLQDAIRESKKMGYVPARIEQMLQKESARSVAKRLVVSSEFHSGLKEMLKQGRQELTIEWIMCDKQFEPLFSPAELDAANWRLRNALV